MFENLPQVVLDNIYVNSPLNFNQISKITNETSKYNMNVRARNVRIVKDYLKNTETVRYYHSSSSIINDAVDIEWVAGFDPLDIKSDQSLYIQQLKDANVVIVKNVQDDLSFNTDNDMFMDQSRFEVVDETLESSIDGMILIGKESPIESIKGIMTFYKTFGGQLVSYEVPLIIHSFNFKLEENSNGWKIKSIKLQNAIRQQLIKMGEQFLNRPTFEKIKSKILNMIRNDEAKGIAVEQRSDEFLENIVYESIEPQTMGTYIHTLSSLWDNRVYQKSLNVYCDKKTLIVNIPMYLDQKYN